MENNWCCVRQTDRKSEALIANMKVIDLSPKDPDAHYNLGITLKELKRINGVEEVMQKRSVKTRLC